MTMPLPRHIGRIPQKGCKFGMAVFGHAEMRAYGDARAAEATKRAAEVCEDLAREAGRNRTPVGSIEGDDGYQCAAAIRGTKC